MPKAGTNKRNQIRCHTIRFRCVRHDRRTVGNTAYGARLFQEHGMGARVSSQETAALMGEGAGLRLRLGEESRRRVEAELEARETTR